MKSRTLKFHKLKFYFGCYWLIFFWKRYLYKHYQRFIPRKISTVRPGKENRYLLVINVPHTMIYCFPKVFAWSNTVSALFIPKCDWWALITRCRYGNMVRAYLGILRNKNSEGCALADIGSILSPLWTRTGTWGMYPCTFVSTIYFVHEESSEIAIWRYRCFSDIFSLEVQDHVGI